MIRIGASLLGAAALVLGGCGGGGDDDAGGGGDGGGSGGPLIIDLVEQNSSGESGTAEMTGNGPVTDILVTTGGVAMGIPNPAGIWKGTCDAVTGKPAYVLPASKKGCPRRRSTSRSTSS